MKLSLSLTTLFVLVALVGGCEPAFGEDDEELDLSSSGTTDDVASFDAATPYEIHSRPADSLARVCLPHDPLPSPPPIGGNPKPKQQNVQGADSGGYVPSEPPKPCPKPNPL